MTAGAIFGVVPGTVIVSIAATAACTAAFLIARYVARDRVAQVRRPPPLLAACTCAGTAQWAPLARAVCFHAAVQ